MQIAMQLFCVFFRFFLFFYLFIVDFQLCGTAISGVFIIGGKQFFHLLEACHELARGVAQQFIGTGAFAEPCQIYGSKKQIPQLFINGILIA
jgi:hypothetical protein